MRFFSRYMCLSLAYACPAPISTLSASVIYGFPDARAPRYIDVRVDGGPARAERVRECMLGGVFGRCDDRAVVNGWRDGNDAHDVFWMTLVLTLSWTTSQA